MSKDETAAGTSGARPGVALVAWLLFAWFALCTILIYGVLS